MKKILFGVAALGLLGLAGAGLGLKTQDTVEAKAASIRGSIILDLTNSTSGDDYWNSAACNIAINFHQGGSWANQEWSQYVSVAKGQTTVSIPYGAFTNEPNQFAIVRYAASYSEESWKSNKWPDAEKWGQSEEVGFHDNLKCFFTDYEAIDTVWIKSSAASWDMKMNLETAKTNGTGHKEYYSYNVSMDAGEEFGMMFDNEWYNTVNYSAVTGKFTGGNGSNIVCATDGTYAFYFNADSHSLYITEPSIAAANDFGQAFLEETADYCTVAVDDSVLTSLKDKYDDLASVSGAQAAFYGSEVKPGKGLSYTTDASEALTRYVDMQINHGYGDFLGLGEDNPNKANTVLRLTESKESGSVATTFTVVAISIAVLGISVFFIARKRRAE